MINILTPSKCCGCSACASICAHNAISMQPDPLGFLYPVVNKDKCTDCGLCDNVCAFNNDYNVVSNLSKPIAYAARHKDLKEIASSQSGAAFVVLSDWILEQGGVVYGVGYDGHFRVVHKKAVTKEQRNEFRGSKYVQSHLNNIFKQVKEDLKSGLIVMFSGTPCQTAGLASFLGKKLRDKLYLMDIICHGVPSPSVWSDYLDYLERKEKKQITGVNFRDKSIKGWHSHVESFTFESKYTYTYKYTYYTDIMLRQSCSICPYTNLKRPSDVTVGDFWGIEKSTAAYLGEDNKGCSLMLLNTDKGQQWFEDVKNYMNIHQVSTTECLQPNLMNPSNIHPKRNQFEADYHKYGFEKTMRLYALMGWRKDMMILRNNTINKAAAICPSVLKKLLKKVINR